MFLEYPQRKLVDCSDPPLFAAAAGNRQDLKNPPTPVGGIH